MPGRGGARAGRSVPPSALLLLSGAVLCGGLPPCSERPSYSATKCPAGSGVACWSSDRAAPWACWPSGLVPTWFHRPASAERTCRSWPVPAVALGAGRLRPSYDGACAFVAAVQETLPTPLEEPLTWEVANQRADEALARMTKEEKYALTRGLYWNELPEWYTHEANTYIGNIAAIPRLQVPSLNMQDASAGFALREKELLSTLTVWPSMLAMAATWDAELTRVLATAIGHEFAVKGANVILGPQLNVIRPAQGGRNVESLSGEDPRLGARLAPAYVAGVQSQGVLAVMKHYVMNEQETDRNAIDVDVDDATAWELYYPPFEAAVRGGVSAVMCSYNKVGGTHACGNEKQLNQVLKGAMGFQGFVQSDWWATKGPSLGAGLDQEMPGNQMGEDGKVWFTPDLLELQPPELVNGAVRRILAAMYRHNITSQCTPHTPPGCEARLERNATSTAHADLAQSLAAESIVLLKNSGNVLPLAAEARLSVRRVRSIAVIGAAAAAGAYDPREPGEMSGDWATGDYYSVGGSGHLTATSLVTPLDGITARAAEARIRVHPSATNDTQDAILAAKRADVAIVVAATTSGESRDRPNLHLDDGADGLIAAVAGHAKQTVVLLQAPGSVLMPWHEEVDGILMMFLGGQRTGAAWADVLFGDHAPTGRLPVMIPRTEGDTLPIVTDPVIHYSEGLRTSYRNPGFAAAFPFGHGLTYTIFTYLPADIVECGEPAGGSVDDAALFCVSVPVWNVGLVAGRTVAQLYIELSSEAGHPVPFLRSFEKTRVLQPQERTNVTFRIGARDVSFFSPTSGAWVQAAAATAHIGESSTDIRQVLALPVSGGAGWSLGVVWLIAAICGLGFLIARTLICWTRRNGRMSSLAMVAGEGRQGSTGDCCGADAQESDTDTEDDEDGARP